MENKQYTTRELFRRFAPYFKKYRFTLCMDLFCAALTTVCELVLPLIMRYITNEGLRDLAALSVKTIFTLGILYFGLHGSEDRDGHAQRCVQSFAEAVQYLL